MNALKTYPDFIIVGAPKCGTTALDYFLNQHPSIFMAKKELHYFGSDLGMIQDELTQKEYLAYFNKAHNDQIKGESSVWYLYSKLAAKEIKEFNPTCKIIILLRKPSEMIPSLHSQYIYNNDEKEENFERALNNDLTKDAPSSFSFRKRPQYIDSALYYKQVNRYITAFGHKQVLIILHEELKNDFDNTYNKVLSFLNVSNTYQPQKEAINQRRKIKNIKLHQASKNPSSTFKKFVRIVIPSKSIRHYLMTKFDDFNIKKTTATPVSKQTKEKIIDLTRNDIKKLSLLINKDLSSWL
jgi:hypothetical protein